MDNIWYQSKGGRRLLQVAGMACTSAILWLGLAQAQGAVVTDHVISESSRAQSNVPVTFGQVFKVGDVPRGNTLAASVDGRPITLQVDPKASNPDGSLRHAVLTAVIPSLRGRSKLPIALSSQADAPTKAEPIALSHCSPPVTTPRSR
jgi:hypothetical protein